MVIQIVNKVEYFRKDNKKYEIKCKMLIRTSNGMTIKMEKCGKDGAEEVKGTERSKQMKRKEGKV